MSVLQVGWAETSITPNKRVSLAGQFAERISEYVEKPVMATVLALDTGNDHVVFCSCDLGGTAWRLVKDVREKLAGNPFGLDPNKIILSAIHTHTGPSYYGGRRSAEELGTTIGSFRDALKAFLQPGQKYVERVSSAAPDIATHEEIYALLLERLPQVILDAWVNRKPGSFSNAFGRAPVGMCRRAMYSDNTAQMWGDTNTALFTALEGGNDSGIELIYFFDADQKLTGILANLACPAQCVQHRMFVSPDFWGEVKVLLRNHFGEDIFLLAQCSAAGDQCPVDLIRWVEPESELNDPNIIRTRQPKRKADPSMFDLVGMKKVGKRIANEIIDVWKEGPNAVQAPAEMEHRIVNMQLPIRRVSLTDRNRAEQGIREYLRDRPGDVDYNDVANIQGYLGVLERFRLQEHLNTLEIETHIIRLGTVAFATNPFELFLDYGNQIKARSLAEQTFLLQLANGTEGYLPTEYAEQHGHYSAFIASGQVGHAGGEQLVRETLQNINSMFAE